jgi:hypothetical protein
MRLPFGMRANTEPSPLRVGVISLMRRQPAFIVNEKNFAARPRTSSDNPKVVPRRHPAKLVEQSGQQRRSASPIQSRWLNPARDELICLNGRLHVRQSEWFAQLRLDEVSQRVKQMPALIASRKYRAVRWWRAARVRLLLRLLTSNLSKFGGGYESPPPPFIDRQCDETPAHSSTASETASRRSTPLTASFVDGPPWAFCISFTVLSAHSQTDRRNLRPRRLKLSPAQTVQSW